MAEVRLQKAIADAGVASRRAAEELIAANRVTVDGVPARLGQRIDPSAVEVAVDGHPIAPRKERVYLAINKPAGVTSTVADPHAERTVLDLLAASERAALGRVYPVGRLDRDSEGLLLLTSDGAWAQRVLHPSNGVEREYAAGLARELSTAERRRLETGIDLPEGRAGIVSLRRATRAETAALLPSLGSATPDLAWYRIVLTQGMKRQIRRMFGALGVPVERLVRVRIGTLRLERMGPGEVRRLSQREAARLAARAPGEDARGAASRTGGLPLVVALDGPGSSGKSTVGALAAARLGYRFCDTGLLYRAVGWLALQRGVAPDDGPAAAALVPDVGLELDAFGRYSRAMAGGGDVSTELSTPEIDRAASQVAGRPEVRAALLPRQRELAAGGAIVMAGRDIGSVVLPDADVKIYLDASVEERARRRIEQRGLVVEADEAAAVLAALRARDAADAGRSTAPLRTTPDAVVLRTDGHTLEESVAAVVAVVEAVLAARRNEGG